MNPTRRRDATTWPAVAGLGLVAGGLILALRLIEYRWLILEQSLALYGAVVAVLFAGLGLWLGQRVVVPAPATRADGPLPLSAQQPPGAPAVDTDAIARSGLTPRELDVLALMATGLSTREIAARAGVSENTIKTHSARVYSKLGVTRRTQAVHVAREQRLIQ